MVLLAANSVNIAVNAGTAGAARTTVSEKQTTGSITAGSDIITVADGSGLSPGDWIVIAAGGEASAGARGTRGVGGAWPALSYANATAMNADASKADAEMCWLEDTGDTYYWNDAGAAWVAVPSTDYYWQKAIPKALTAQITARIGNKIKLDRNAVVSTTNAPVYFDNWGIIQGALTDNLTVNVPAGTYWCSGFFRVEDKTGQTLAGAGKSQTFIKTPRGACPVGLVYHECNDSIVRDMTFDLGFKNVGYSMQWSDSRVGGEFYPNGLWREFYRDVFGLPRGVFFEGQTGNEALDCDVVNPGIQGFITSFGTDHWLRRCTVTVEDTFQSYTQWMIQFADSTNCGAEDCIVDSNFLIAALEPFKSTGIQFIRCSTRNGGCAINSSDNVLYDELSIVVEEDSRSNPGSWSALNPIINVNVNAAGGYNTITNEFRNPTIIIEGYPETAALKRANAFALNGNGAPVLISGTYDTDAVTPKGLIDLRYSVPDVDGNSGYGVNGGSGTSTATVEGIRIKGTAPFNGTSTILSSRPMTVTNCIFDDATPDGVGPFTLSGNQTNAEYEA